MAGICVRVGLGCNLAGSGESGKGFGPGIFSEGTVDRVDFVKGNMSGRLCPEGIVLGNLYGVLLSGYYVWGILLRGFCPRAVKLDLISASHRDIYSLQGAIDYVYTATSRSIN